MGDWEPEGPKGKESGVGHREPQSTVPTPGSGAFGGLGNTYVFQEKPFHRAVGGYLLFVSFSSTPMFQILKY